LAPPRFPDHVLAMGLAVWDQGGSRGGERKGKKKKGRADAPVSLPLVVPPHPTKKGGDR